MTKEDDNSEKLKEGSKFNEVFPGNEPLQVAVKTDVSGAVYVLIIRLLVRS
jgi:hypothetical protein